MVMSSLATTLGSVRDATLSVQLGKVSGMLGWGIGEKTYQPCG